MKDSARKAMFAKKKPHIISSDIVVADYFDHANDDFGRQLLLQSFGNANTSEAKKYAKRSYYNLPEKYLNHMKFNLTKGEVAVLYHDNGYKVD
jgi:hypothetical protein